MKQEPLTFLNCLKQLEMRICLEENCHYDKNPKASGGQTLNLQSESLFGVKLGMLSQIL